MAEAYVAMGGNVGDVAATFMTALSRLDAETGIRLIRPAGLYQSVAMGSNAGDVFLNSACVLEVALSPFELLQRLHQIEEESGRTRALHWGPRTLDLDLVFFDQATVSLPDLTVPHPHAWYRRFVLEPLIELCPDFVHPVIGQPVTNLRDRLHRKPFRLLLSGEAEPTDVALAGFSASLEENSNRKASVPRKQLEELAGRMVEEFAGLTAEVVGEVTSEHIAGCSLAVCLSSRPAEALPPLCLNLTSDNPEQSLRDALTAACTEVVRAGDLAAADTRPANTRAIRRD